MITYLNMSQLRAKLGNRSRASIYRDVAAGRLPRPRKLGATLLWDEPKVDEKVQGTAGQDSETA